MATCGSEAATVPTLGVIDRPDMLRAIADEHRMQILRLTIAGPQTLTSLGAAMGQHPAWVRHHVKVLEAAGLVALVEERKTRNYTEKFYRATAVAFTLALTIRAEPGENRPLVALASDDFAFDLLANSSAESGERFATAVLGSLDSLIAVRQGLADIAGCHLIDFETGQYNVPYVRHVFPDRDIIVVTLANREQGLVVAPGNPLGLASFGDIAEKHGRFVNRNRGSGTRLLVDHTVVASGLTPADILGYEDEVRTHSEAAARIAAGLADAALGIEAAAAQYELSFVPLLQERYDLVMPVEIYESTAAAQLLEVLQRPEFRKRVARLSGYDVAAMGDEYRVAV